MVSIQLKKPFASATVDSFGSIVYKTPSYLIFDLEIRLILLPRKGILLPMATKRKERRKLEIEIASPKIKSGSCSFV